MIDAIAGVSTNAKRRRILIGYRQLIEESTVGGDVAMPEGDEARGDSDRGDRE